MNSRISVAVAGIEQQVEEFDRILRESPTAEIIQRLTRWKQRTTRILRDKVSKEEASKFEQKSLAFDSSHIASFDLMLTAQRTFLTILSDELRLHPEDFFGDRSVTESWEAQAKRVLRVIAEFESGGHDPSLADVQVASGLTTLQAEIMIRALLDRGYIAGKDASTFDGFDIMAIRLLPSGRQSIGQWEDNVRGEKQSRSDIRVFISHSSADAEVASALIHVLRDALALHPDTVRCTSVDGYRLPAGANTKERIRSEVFESEVFLGLISNDSLRSTFVLFELGARWGAERHLIPLLIRDCSPAALTGPLSDLNALQLSEQGQIYQLITDLGDLLNISPVTPAASLKAVQQLAMLNRPTAA